MRATALLLVALCAACCSVGVLAATQGALGQAQVTGTQYGYGALGAAPFVTVSTTTSATATVSLIISTTANSMSSFGITGLPDGVTATSNTFLSAAVGLQVDVSANASAVSSIQITFPALTVDQQTSFAAGVLGVLFFSVDTQTYVRLPASAVSLDGSSQLNVNWKQEGYFYIVNFSTAPITKSIASGVQRFLVAANTTANYYITVSASANAQAQIAVQNFTAAAGSLAVATSTQAQANAQQAVQAGRVVLSNIYNITYTGASNSVQASLVFYASTTTATANTYNAATAAWYRLDHSVGVWVKQASTINADASVSVSVSGFSDWSVQADSTSSSSSSSGNGGGSGGGAAAVAPMALLLAALATVLLA